ncbi:MAG TPA: ORF6N domain-containing protein [Burkholderiaceae bacterium]|nr:ORF6N domain-containing protein [Burkholderiaceae bacterium]
MAKNAPVAAAALAQRILTLRGQRVMVDADLAELYGVSTRALNQAVKRNAARFPEDFMFRLTRAEKERLVVENGRLARLKFSPVLPFAFTEHGAIQAANVLNSSQAVAMGVHVVRAFVKARALAASHKDLASKLAAFERRLLQATVQLHEHDAAIENLVHAIRELTAAPPKTSRRIGFSEWKEGAPARAKDSGRKEDRANEKDRS